MKLTVRVKPNARMVEVTELADGSYRVSVIATPERGRANRAVVEALAEHFHVAPSHVVILAGHTARTKIVEVRGLGSEPHSA